MVREIIMIKVLIYFDPFHLNVSPCIWDFCLHFLVAREKASLMIYLLVQQTGILVGRWSIEKKKNGLNVFQLVSLC